MVSRLHFRHAWGRRAEDPFRGLRAGPVRTSPHFCRNLQLFQPRAAVSQYTPEWHLTNRRRCASSRIFDWELFRIKIRTVALLL
jgi:hypothetical protein